MSKLIGAILASALLFGTALAGEPTLSTTAPAGAEASGLDWIPAESDLLLQGPVHIVSREEGRAPRRGGLTVSGAVVTWNSTVLADESPVGVGTTILAGAFANRSGSVFALVDGQGVEHLVAPMTVVLVGVDIRPGDTNETEVLMIVPSVNLKTATVTGFGLGTKLVKKCSCRCGPTGPLQLVVPPKGESCIEQNGKACTDDQGASVWQLCRKRYFSDGPGGKA